MKHKRQQQQSKQEDSKDDKEDGSDDSDARGAENDESEVEEEDSDGELKNDTKNESQSKLTVTSNDEDEKSGEMTKEEPTKRKHKNDSKKRRNVKQAADPPKSSKNAKKRKCSKITSPNDLYKGKVPDEEANSKLSNSPRSSGKDGDDEKKENTLTRNTEMTTLADSNQIPAPMETGSDKKASDEELDTHSSSKLGKQLARSPEAELLPLNGVSEKGLPINNGGEILSKNAELKFDSGNHIPQDQSHKMATKVTRHAKLNEKYDDQESTKGECDRISPYMTPRPTREAMHSRSASYSGTNSERYCNSFTERKNSQCGAQPEVGRSPSYSVSSELDYSERRPSDHNRPNPFVNLHDSRNTSANYRNNDRGYITRLYSTPELTADVNSERVAQLEAGRTPFRGPFPAKPDYGTMEVNRIPGTARFISTSEFSGVSGEMTPTQDHFIPPNGLSSPPGSGSRSLGCITRQPRDNFRHRALDIHYQFGNGYENSSVHRPMAHDGGSHFRHDRSSEHVSHESYLQTNGRITDRDFPVSYESSHTPQYTHSDNGWPSKPDPLRDPDINFISEEHKSHYFPGDQGLFKQHYHLQDRIKCDSAAAEAFDMMHTNYGYGNSRHRFQPRGVAKVDIAQTAGLLSSSQKVLEM